MATKRPSSEVKRAGSVGKAAPPAVTGRYSALSSRWMVPSHTGWQLVAPPTLLEEGHSGPPKAKAAKAAKSEKAAKAAKARQDPAIAKKMAARRESSSTGEPSKAAKKSSAAGQYLTQDAPPNPYAMTREQVFKVLRDAKVLTSGGRLTKVFK